jgi:tetratricopeptide (TPR) repeat protein
MMPNKKFFALFGALPLLAATWFFQRSYLEKNPLQTASGSRAVPASVPVTAPVAQDATLIRLKQAVTAVPQDVRRRWALADAYQKRGDLANAAQQLRAITKTKSNDFDAHLALAQVLLVQEQTTEAVQSFQKAVRLKKDSTEAWQGLATAFYHRRRFYESLEAARRSLSLAPNDANNKIILASAALDYATQFPSPHKTRSAELKLARQLLESAISKWPQNGDLRLRLGTVYLAQKDSAAAVSALREAAKLQPQRETPQVFLGRALMMANRRDEARRHAEKMLTVFPDNAEFHQMLSKIWRGVSTDEGKRKSYEFIRKAAELAPKNADYQETLGLAALRVNKIDEAKVAFNRALQLNPYSRVPYLQLAAINNQQGQSQEATKFAKSSSEINAREGELRELEKLAEATPLNAAVRATLADWYRKRGFIAAARDTYLQALRLEPKNTRIQIRLREAETELQKTTAATR